MVDSLSNLTAAGMPQVGGVPGGVAQPGGQAEGAGGTSFKDVLLKNLGEVNKLQEDADTTLENYVSGKSGNMGEVISASQKANMAFSMLVQIRNKLQEAYDEVKNLRV